MKEKVYRTCIASPIGPLEIEGTEQGITQLLFSDRPLTETEVPEPLQNCVSQLKAYFAGRRKTFELDLIPQGTDFQKAVWKKLMAIPFGETVSYQDIALSLGDINGVRAVGNANGKNRIPVIIPCHRVIGKNGRLVGFGGGLWRKQWLLDFEKKGLGKYGSQT